MNRGDYGQEAFVPNVDDVSTTPHRVRLSRAKGWRLPPNTVSVARPGRWGNPFRVGDFGIPSAREAVIRFREWMDGRVAGPKQPDPYRLRGKNLACWCKLDAPCHADVLLELANAGSPDSVGMERSGMNPDQPASHGEGGA